MFSATSGNTKTSVLFLWFVCLLSLSLLVGSYNCDCAILNCE